MEKELIDVLRPLLNDLDDGRVCMLMMYFDDVECGVKFFYPQKTLKGSTFELMKILHFCGGFLKYVEKQRKIYMQTYVCHKFYIFTDFVYGKCDEIN